MRSEPIPASEPTRARLSLVLLLYFLCIIATLTLAPFHFVVPARLHVMYTGEWLDVVANVLLFVPLGFLYPLTRSNRAEMPPVSVFVLGGVLSGLIETTQLFEPERYSSVIDVLTNAGGAAIGALLARAISRRVRVNARFVGRLSLEIPLIGLIYVLLPLVLVASFMAADDRLRMLALLPLALVGARLFSSVQRHHFGPNGLLSDRTMILAAGGWTVLGTFPILLRYPLGGVALVAAVVMMTWYEISRQPGADPDRRFESDALRSAAPYLITYLLMVIVLPLGAGVGHWHFEMRLTGIGDDSDAQMLRLLEPVATSTVLGWVLAEARSRRELPFARAVSRVALECAGIALVMEASRGIQPGLGASGAQFLLIVIAGAFGAGMYHNQRAHVRWVLAHRGDVSSHDTARPSRLLRAS
jgi:glycopeptide antibiotics resistance protein